MSSEKRQAALNKFEESFYKLRNKDFYGKNCGSKRRRMKVELTRDAKRTLTIVSKNYIFSVWREHGSTLLPPKKDLLGHTDYSRGHNTWSSEILHISVLLWNNAIFIWLSITLLLYWQLAIPDQLWRSLKESNVLHQFDFSNCTEYHKLSSKENKRFVSKFKGEFSGDYLKEFLCLKPKLYSITSASECFMFNDSDKKRKYQLTMYDCQNMPAFFFHR